MVRVFFTKQNTLNIINGTKKIISDLGIIPLIYATLSIAIIALLEEIGQLEYLDTLNKKYMDLSINMKVALICIGICLLLVIIKNFNKAVKTIIKVFIIPYINFSDGLMWGVLLGITVEQNLVIKIIDSQQHKNQNSFEIILELITILLIIMLALRFFIIRKKYYSMLINPSFLVSDVPAKEDLLKRKTFINNLKVVIEKLKVEGSFVIGLYGRWGEGKSTTLKLMTNEIEKNKDFIIVNFDPWYYNSKDAIIKNFFNNIFSEINKRYFYLDLMSLVTKYKELLLTSLDKTEFKDIGKAIFPLLETDTTVNKIKIKIQKKLVQLDKKVLILIDDIDRMDKEEILLVFKLVKLCSDFENFIYILSFDKERVESILKHEIKDDSIFLEKIIQIGIELPKIEGKILDEVLIDYINKVFNHYNINFNSGDLDRFKSVIPYITNLFKDVRSVKRFINLLSIKIPLAMETLNLYDFFIVTIIEYFFPKKSREMYVNKNMFTYFTEDINTHLDSKKNENRKEFYNVFFQIESDKEILLHLLCSIFTSVKNYNHGYSNLISNYKTDYTKLKNKNIEDAHFFDAYFTFEKTHFMVINEKIIDFVNTVNLLKDNEKLDLSEFKVFFMELKSYDDQLIFLENLKGFIDDVDKSKINILVKIIYRNSHLLSDESGFMALSPYRRSEALVAEIIEKTEDRRKQSQIFENIILECDYLEFIKGVIYFTKKDAEENKELSNIRNTMISKFTQRLKNEYINSERDVLEENQRFGGLWCFENYINDKKSVSDYYYKLIDKKLSNIVLFLSIFKTKSTASNSEKAWVITKFDIKGLEEYFDKERINKFLDKYIATADIINNEELYIIDLFKKYYNGYVDNDL